MPPWLTLALEGAAELPTVAQSLAHLIGAVENELNHGSGTTDPRGIVETLVGALDDITSAVTANTKAVNEKAPVAAAAESKAS